MNRCFFILLTIFIVVLFGCKANIIKDEYLFKFKITETKFGSINYVFDLNNRGRDSVSQNIFVDITDEFKLKKQGGDFELTFLTESNNIRKFSTNIRNKLSLIHNVDIFSNLIMNDKGKIIKISSFDKYKFQLLDKIGEVKSNYPSKVVLNLIELVKSNDFYNMVLQGNNKIWFYIIPYWSNRSLKLGGYYQTNRKEFFPKMGEFDVLKEIRLLEVNKVEDKKIARIEMLEFIRNEDIYKALGKSDFKYKIRRELITEVSTLVPYYYIEEVDINIPDKNIESELKINFNYQKM